MNGMEVGTYKKFPKLQSESTKILITLFKENKNFTTRGKPQRGNDFNEEQFSFHCISSRVQYLGHNWGARQTAKSSAYDSLKA